MLCGSRIAHALPLPKVLYRVSEFFYTPSAPAQAPAKCNSFSVFSADEQVDARLYRSAELQPLSSFSERSLDCGFSKCITCCEQPADVVMMPCGHAGLCRDCVAAADFVCPVCRSQVTHTLKLQSQTRSVAQVQPSDASSCSD